ncbi:hypothetical protein IAQ61_002937, partial [Plenodomus lingam]|uniref:uncharacterized protein n=1 Tax=Leptosphaeria maculans TaxID=5022 RepID=UPI00331DF998
MSETKDMVVILTGASRGIGLSTAHHLLSTNLTTKLLITARTLAPLAALQAQYGAARVEVLAGDAADFSLAGEAVERVLRRWGRLDALVVNHGGLEPVRKVGESSVEEWRAAFDRNVFGGLSFIQAALPALRTSHGRIILISSGAATTAYQGWAAYGAGKAVLNHLALSLAVEEPLVTSIALRPGVVDTEMQREIREVHAAQMSEGDRGKFLGLKEGGKLVRPERVGAVVGRLAVGVGRELSGRFLSWDDEVLAGFQGEEGSG